MVLFRPIRPNQVLLALLMTIPPALLMFTSTAKTTSVEYLAFPMSVQGVCQLLLRVIETSVSAHVFNFTTLGQVLNMTGEETLQLAIG